MTTLPAGTASVYHEGSAGALVRGCADFASIVLSSGNGSSSAPSPGQVPPVTYHVVAVGKAPYRESARNSNSSRRREWFQHYL